MPAKDNPFTQGAKAKKPEPPTIDELAKSAAQAFTMLGEAVSATAGHLAKLAAVLPETQEVRTVKVRAARKLNDIADAL